MIRAESVAGIRIPHDYIPQRQLDGLWKKRIIYFYAPAGFGKTVSAQLWLAHRGKLGDVRQKTVSFDAYDGNALGFCRRFVSALSNVLPENGRLTELAENNMFDSAPVEFALRALSVLNTSVAGNARLVLAFDDLHVITSPEVLNLLIVLINRLPENFTVLLLEPRSPARGIRQYGAEG